MDLLYRSFLLFGCWFLVFFVPAISAKTIKPLLWLCSMQVMEGRIRATEGMDTLRNILR